MNQALIDKILGILDANNGEIVYRDLLDNHITYQERRILTNAFEQAKAQQAFIAQNYWDAASKTLTFRVERYDVWQSRQVSSPS